VYCRQVSDVIEGGEPLYLFIIYFLAILYKQIYNQFSYLTMSDTSMLVKKYVVKPAAVGLTGAAIAYVLVGTIPGRVKVMGMTVSPVVAISMTMAAGDIIGSVVGDQLRKLPQAQGLADMEERILTPLLTGGGCIAASYIFMNGADGFPGMLKLASVGAASEIGGTYLSSLVTPLF
jgi:hypothetical protein